MSTTPKTLWQTLDALGQQMPFTKDKVEQALGSPLQLHAQDQYKSHWVGGSISLQDNLRIADTSLVLGPTGEFKPTSGATLNLAGDGACVTLEQVAARYDDLKIVGQPRGRSPQESTDFAATQPWGRLIFAFRESNPDCLAFVSLRAAPDN